MSIHTIGNGSICAYYEGATIIQAFGPTYSSTNGFSLDAGEGWEVSRLAIGLFSSVRDDVTLTDYADGSGLPILYRTISGKTTMRLHTEQPLFMLPESIGANMFMSECHGGGLMHVNGFENGLPTGYVSAKKRYFGVSLRGDLTLTPSKNSECENKDWLLEGKGTVVFAFSDQVDTLIEYLKRDDTIVVKPNPAFIDNLSAKQKPFASQVLDVYDTVSAQTAKSGGVIAGYSYHLCYLRDNYGVYRGLRAIGAHTEADELARYYIRVYRQYKDIHNAQGPEEYAFHIHENDNTEITAYMALILCDYINRHVVENEYFEHAWSFLKLMLERQHNQMIDGMLPFNGDETYIAGGILSRACINDGSMEATALYHKSICEAKTVSKMLNRYDLPTFLTEDQQKIEATFRDNFFVNGVWVCNHPNLISPCYRHGVRACGHGFGIAFRNENEDYICQKCLDKKLEPIWQGGGKQYAIPAAILSSAFVDSPLISVAERTQAALEVLDNCSTAGRGTGYDLGLVLWALSEPEALTDTEVRIKANEVLVKLLSMSDEFGAYSEYYEDGFTRHIGTLCRPWESCINIAAILRAAEAL